MRFKYLYVLCFVFGCCYRSSFGQYTNVALYREAYESLCMMLLNPDQPSFKHAVFITENAYLDNRLSYTDFRKEINSLVVVTNKWMNKNKLCNYALSDSVEVFKSYAICTVLTDTVHIALGKNTIYTILPYTYDFEDFLGNKDWSSMFVTRLLATNSGNCHSMPYLYKILADELGISNVWLSFAPNHIYIKNLSKKTGWYNTELTSGQFPVDAWITASGFISMDAIRSGIYMDTLSNRQAVAHCVYDLAKGYERKTHNYVDSFIIRCCDLVLRFHPNNINAIIYKAETLRKMYRAFRNTDPIYAAKIYKAMETVYLAAMDMGYKEMPEKMYRQWIGYMQKQKNGSNNKKMLSLKK